MQNFLYEPCNISWKRSLLAYTLHHLAHGNGTIILLNPYPFFISGSIGYISRLHRTSKVIKPQYPASQPHAPSQLRDSTNNPSPDPFETKRTNLSSNGNLNLNTSLDVDDDLLDGLGGGKQAV